LVLLGGDSALIYPILCIDKINNTYRLDIIDPDFDNSTDNDMPSYPVPYNNQIVASIQNDDTESQFGLYFSMLRLFLNQFEEGWNTGYADATNEFGSDMQYGSYDEAEWEEDDDEYDDEEEDEDTNNEEQSKLF